MTPEQLISLYRESQLFFTTLLSEFALDGYVIVPAPKDLEIGHYIRWVNEHDQLAIGGFVCEVYENEQKEKQITCRNAGIGGRYFTVKWLPNTLVFRKLRNQEQLILMAALQSYETDVV